MSSREVVHRATENLAKVIGQTRSRVVLVFETMSHCLSLVDLELNLQTRLVLTHRNLPASAQVLGLKEYTSMPSKKQF